MNFKKGYPCFHTNVIFIRYNKLFQNNNIVLLKLDTFKALNYIAVVKLP